MSPGYFQSLACASRYSLCGASYDYYRGRSPYSLLCCGGIGSSINFFLSWTAWSNYEAAWVSQSAVVEYEYYEFVADTYDYDTNGTLIRNDDLVKFDYLPDNKSRKTKPKMFYASQVSIYSVEESQKPCWKVITTTQIRVNSKTGKVKEEVFVRNELYVPS